MSKIIKLFILITFLISACGSQPMSEIYIIPTQCVIPAGEEFPISLQISNMPSDTTVSWEVTKGEVNPPAGISVVYTAPQEPGTVIITALLETDSKKYTSTLVCTIEQTTAPEEVIIPGSVLPTEINEVSSNATTIAITEVMAAPCDGVLGPGKNEYIELYNYGNTTVDVDGWWIAYGEGGNGTPDRLTTWNDVNTGVSLGAYVITDTTAIPPGGFAIVLSPRYHLGSGRNLMPYIFPENTIVLTLSNSEYLGNDATGLFGNSIPYTVLVLYTGSETVMDIVVSTYGTPNYGSSPQNVYDNNIDAFPFSVPDCHSMERIIPSGKDVVSNWTELNEGTPGEGNYP